VKRSARRLALAALVAALCACTSQVETFIPLPPPVDGGFPMTQLVQTVGTTEQVELMSPRVSVTYGETASQAGGVAHEELRLKEHGRSGTLVDVYWGDWRQGRVRRAESYDPTGQLVEGRVTLVLDRASLLQVLSGCGRCVIDRSRLVFSYAAPSPGQRPELREVLYLEEWGADSAARLGFGTTAVWTAAGDLFPEQRRWGFWETHASPFTQVTAALERARAALSDRPPTFQVTDLDGPRELIGRQTGLVVQRDGARWGTIDFTYANGWGRMPNTPAIGQGALSRVEWRLGERYHAMSVLSPALSPEPTSLFVFSNDPAVAAGVERADWPTLYEQLRRGELPGVTFAVYAIGHIGKITGTVDTSDGPKSVDVGQGGGVFYATIGDASRENVRQAHQLLSLLGLGGIKASGNYYATKPLSGNGLSYYLAILRVLTAPPEDALARFGDDVGVLDRPGFPEWTPFAGR
jgi:hypothetical protein